MTRKRPSRSHARMAMIEAKNKLYLCAIEITKKRKAPLARDLS